MYVNFSSLEHLEFGSTWTPMHLLFFWESLYGDCSKPWRDLGSGETKQACTHPGDVHSPGKQVKEEEEEQQQQKID